MLKRLGLTVLVVMIAAQFYRPSRTNPPEDPQQRIQAHVQIPAEVATTIQRSCSDCHSHGTVWPWYSNVSPASWILASHVRHAREHLNFSEWGGYDRAAAIHHLQEICEEVSGGEMPLASYLWIHRGARLSGTEVKSVCDWTASARRALAAPPAAGEGGEAGQ